MKIKKGLLLGIMLLFTLNGYADVSLNNVDFKNLRTPVTTVKKAIKLSNKTWIILDGKITKALDDGTYEFTDGDEIIIVKINDNLISPSSIPFNKEVRISGEIEKKAWKKGKINIEKIDEIDNTNDYYTKKYDTRFDIYSPNLTRTSVKETLSLPNKSVVLLEGKITKLLGDRKYTLSDGTGSITIELANDIKEELSKGQDIKITGELKAKLFKPKKVGVKKIEF